MFLLSVTFFRTIKSQEAFKNLSGMNSSIQLTIFQHFQYRVYLFFEGFNFNIFLYQKVPFPKPFVQFFAFHF